MGWNGDPCVPQLHPWYGVDCKRDTATGLWMIDGLYVPQTILFYFKLCTYAFLVIFDSLYLVYFYCDDFFSLSYHGIQFSATFLNGWLS